MPNHLSSIGLAVESQGAFLALINDLAPKSQAITLPQGRYFHWTDVSGAELWIQADASNERVGAKPHYRGQGRMKVGLTARLSRPNDTPLDGELDLAMRRLAPGAGAGLGPGAARITPK